MFGWCSTNQHDQCIVKYKRFWLEKKKRKTVVVYDTEYRLCDCPCHDAKVEPKPKPKPRARKRKS